MPPVTFNSVSIASPASTRLYPSASWQDKRSERVHRLEAELAAAKERRKADETTNGDVSPTPDYGSMLESEQENDSSDSDARSESSSLFYTEGQPLLCTYQPLAYPGGISANYGATPATAPPKSPEQYLPWDRRVYNVLQGLCGSCLAGSDR